MSDETILAPADAGDRVAVLRAAVLAVIGHGAPAPRPDSGHPAVPGGEIFVASGPGPFGYQMSGELVVLEKLSLDSERPGAPAGTGNEGSATGGGGKPRLTTTDVDLSRVTAFVFDRLVNPVLSPAPTAVPIADRTPLNDVYEEVLQHAEFADPDPEGSPDVRAAEALLFGQNEDGSRGQSDTYATYLDFEQRVQAAEDELAALPKDAPAERRDRIRQHLGQLTAEWAAVGHRSEVRHAIDVINKGQDAGFEDERRRLLERLRSMQRKRLDAVGQTYCESQLVPLAPLLATPDEATGWSSAQLDAAAVRAVLTSSTPPLVDPATLESGIEGLDSLSFEHLSVDVVRDWLKMDFFFARYWRLADGDTVSDGHGGGRLPGFPTRLVFVRAVKAEYTEGPVADFGDRAAPPAALKPVRVALQQPGQGQAPVSTARALEMARGSGLRRAARLLQAERTPPTEGQFAPPSTSRPPSRPPARPVPAQPRPRRTAHTVISAIRLPVLNLRGRGRVRDHRRPRPDHRDHRTNHQVEAASAVRVDAVVASERPDLLDGLALQVATPDGTWHPVSLDPRSAGTAGGRLELHVGRPGPAELQARLTGPGGRELDRRTVTSSGGSAALRWQLRTGTTQLQLTSAVAPTLGGYGVTCVPECPRPDPTLHWRQ